MYMWQSIKNLQKRRHFLRPTLAPLQTQNPRFVSPQESASADPPDVVAFRCDGRSSSKRIEVYKMMTLTYLC